MAQPPQSNLVIVLADESDDGITPQLLYKHTASWIRQPIMDPRAQPAETQVEGSRSGGTHIHQEGSRFGPTHATGGSVFQGNFVGLTISKFFLPTTAA